MIKRVHVKDILSLCPLLDELDKQNCKLPINTALKLKKLIKEVQYIDNYVLERLIDLIPNLKNTDTILTENEKQLYDVILNSEVDLDNHDLTMDELQKNEDLMVSIQLADKLLVIL